MTKPKARKGELTGRYAVFFATWPNGNGEYVAIARLEKLREDCEATYDFTVLLAFDKKGASLVLDPTHLMSGGEMEGSLCVGLNTVSELPTFTDAFIYAHGLLSEGNRWREADTMKTVGKVIAHFRRLNIAKSRAVSHERESRFWASEVGATFVQQSRLSGDPLEYSGMKPVIRVDEIGVGRGVSDRLKEAEYPCIPFNASRRPTSESNQELYANLRAEAYARFRSKLIKGEVGLPYSKELEEELRTCCCFTNSSGRLQVWSKEDWRVVLKRSPDRLDSVIMAVAADGITSFDYPSQTLAF